MPVRFKCQSEYQQSFGVSRSRSASPQRCIQLAGLRSDQMGISREPCFQRRRRFAPLGGAVSCASLLCEPDVQPPPRRKTPPAACKSDAAPRKVTPPSVAPPHPEPETPPGPRPPADSEPPEKPDPVDPAPMANGNSGPDEFISSKPSRPEEKVDRGLQWRAGLRSERQHSKIHRSEYHKQFGWKNLFPVESPLLTAEQVLFSSSRSVPILKAYPVSTETEYRRSFQPVSPTAKSPPRKHPEQERIPLFQIQKTERKTKEESPKKSRPQKEEPLKATPPPATHRNPDAGEGLPNPAILQMRELREKARLYRHRGWGTNFSRVHLGQLMSEHNALWEPSESYTTPSPKPESSHISGVEPLELPSHSSKRSSFDSGQKHPTNKKTQGSSLSETRTAWEEDKENTDDEEGRLPTPSLKTRPVQRTHHDLTTPAAGGAILVGNLKPAVDDDASPQRQQRRESVVSIATQDNAPIDVTPKRKEAWLEKSATPSNPSPNCKLALTSPSKPIRPQRLSQSAPPRKILSAVHGIQGTMRHPDFQHNGELGLRSREQTCLGGACCSNEDDRLSVMSWRSAASCSQASAILQRAQKRRENFWLKR